MIRTRVHLSGTALVLSIIVLTIGLGAAVTFPVARDHGSHAPPTNARSSLPEQVRNATAIVRDVNHAIESGDEAFGVCVSSPTAGARGVHFVNQDLLIDGALNVDRPEALTMPGTPARRLAFVVAGAAACVTRVHAHGRERLHVAVRLRIDPSLASRRIREGLKEATEKVWTPYGVRLHWADDGVVTAADVFLDADVVRRRHDGQNAERAAVLGNVVLGPDAPAWRPIRVWFDATESVLAERRTTSSASVARIVHDRELSRALGRVLAHEIGHALIGAPHDRDGLMRATLNAAQLAKPDVRPFRLAPSSVDRLATQIRSLAKSTPIPPGFEPSLGSRAE